MDYESFFSTRLTQLRQEAGVSARDMSLSIGQSQGYINKIENRQNFPSMLGFFYICDYLKITPMEFFDVGAKYPQRIDDIAKKINSLSAKQLDALEIILDTMIDVGK